MFRTRHTISITDLLSESIHPNKDDAKKIIQSSFSKQILSFKEIIEMFNPDGSNYLGGCTCPSCREYNEKIFSIISVEFEKKLIEFQKSYKGILDIYVD